MDVLLSRVTIGQVGSIRANVQLESNLERSIRYIRVGSRRVCPSDTC